MSNNLIEIMRFEVGVQSFGILRSHVQSVQQGNRSQTRLNDTGDNQLVLPTTRGDIPIVLLADLLTGMVGQENIDEHILVLRSEWGLWGLMVGRVAQAELISEQAIQPLPNLARVVYADSMLTHGDDILLMLNPVAIHPNAPEHNMDNTKSAPGVDWENTKPVNNSHLVLFQMPGTGTSETMYAVGLTPKQIDEVVRNPTLQAVPTAPDYVRGVINWRGRLVPVLDLGLRYGLTKDEDEKSPTGSEGHSRVVIAHGKEPEKLIAFYADLQVEFLSLPAPHKRIVQMDGAAEDLMHGAVVYSGQPVIIPHLENLASSHSLAV